MDWQMKMIICYLCAGGILPLTYDSGIRVHACMLDVIQFD